MLIRLIILALLNVFAILSYAQEKRIALVIGNANYSTEAVLQNPINDALLMEITLKNLGFDVMVETDIETRGEFVEVIEKYNESRKRYNIGIVYYAGHAVQINGVNYMLATKEKYETESNIKYNGLDISIFTSEWDNVYNNELNILILDACRNNPFEKKIYGEARDIKSNGLGLAEINRSSQPAGSLVAFSTAAGKTAADAYDGSKNSLYCMSLCKNLQLEDVSIRNIFGKVSREIYMQTGQYPELSDKMFDVDFYLKKSTFQDEILIIDSLIDAEDFSLANEKTLLILGKSINNKEALLRKGRIEWRTNVNYNGSHLHKADSLYPNDIEVLEYLSRYYSIKGFLEKAIWCIDRAISLENGNASLYYWKAIIYQNGGDLENAEKYFETYVEIDKSLKSKYQFIDFYVQINKIDEALQILDGLIENYPNNAYLHSKRGDIFFRHKKKFESALLDFTQSILLNPDDITYLIKRGEFYNCNDPKNQYYNIENSIADFLNVLSIDSMNTQAIRHLGENYSIIRDHKLAHKFYNQLINCSQGDFQKLAEGHEYYADYFWDNNQLDSAIAHYTQAINFQPSNPDLYYYRGAIFLSNGNYLLALVDYSQSIFLDSSDIDFYIARADLYFRYLNDYDNGIKDLSSIIKLQNNKISSFEDISTIIEGIRKIGGNEKAIDFCEIGIVNSIGDDISSSIYYFGKGYCLRLNQDYDSVIHYYSKAIQFYQDYFYYVERGNFYTDVNKRYDLAIIDFKYALKLKPNDEDAIYNLAYINHLKGNISDEKYYLDRLLQINENNILGLNLTGVNLNLEGNYDKAIEVFNRGIKYKYTWPIASALCYANRAGSYALKKDFISAKIDFESAIQLDSKNSIIFYQRALFWKDFVNNYDSSLIDIKQAIMLDFDNPNYYITAGEIYFNLKDYKNSVKYYVSSLKIDTLNIDVINWVGFLYNKLDMLDSAEYYLSLGIDNFDSNNESTAVLYAGRARIKSKRGDFIGALQDYNTCIALNRKSSWVYGERARFYLEYLGDTTEAIKDLETAKKYAQNYDYEIYLLSSRINLQLKKYSEGMKDIDQAIELQRNLYFSNEDLERAYLLKLIISSQTADLKTFDTTFSHHISEINMSILDAKIEIFHSNYLEALSILEIALNKSKYNSEISYYLAICFENLNQPLEASVHYTTALLYFKDSNNIMDLDYSILTKAQIIYRIAKFYESVNAYDLMYDYLLQAKELITDKNKIINRTILNEIEICLDKFCKN